VVGRESLPPLLPRVKPSEAVEPTAQAGIQRLSDRLGRALVGVGDAAPALRVAIAPAAGYQLQVAWVAGVRWPNRSAAAEVRRQVLAILHVVSRSELRHGTVLLMASGPKWARGSRTRRETSVVVRAKYSAHLVDTTRWADVSVADVLGLCDDKPAVVAKGYR
jgi:hypothetical protein